MTVEEPITDLYRAHAAYLVRKAYRLTGNWATAEDLAQEAWLTARRRLDDFDGRYPQAWLGAILRGHVRTWRRSQHRHPEDLAGLVPALPASPRKPTSARRELADRCYIGPEETAIANESLARCLGLLTLAERRVIVAVDIEGRTYPAAAHRLGMSTTAVRARVFAGRRRLRNCLLEAA